MAGEVTGVPTGQLGTPPTGPAGPSGGERRPVTALFADVVGSTTLAESMDPEEWALVVNRLFQAASAATNRYGGTVTQLSGDAIVVLFGAPTAHEDDPERAVRAAVEVVERVGTLAAAIRSEHGVELQVRVGVNTGLAVVGQVGGPGHQEYTALGDTLNVAARMQSAARPGTVLITQATYDRVRTAVDTIDLGPIEVKGKTEPVRAFEVTGVRERAGATRGIAGLHSPMVGRAAELARLEQLLGVVRAGRGRAALVVGEPGIGKSRLLAELRAHVPADVVWLEGRAVSYGRGLPYHLVAELVRSLGGGGNAATGDAALGRLRELLPSEGNDAVVAHLAHLLGSALDQPAQARLARLDPSAIQQHYVASLRQLVAALAAYGPVVLVGEDLHWADRSSVELLERLLPIVHEAPVLLLATSRADRESDGWRLVEAARHTLGDALSEVQLAPLTPDDSRAMVAHLLEIESLPKGLRDRILAKTDGNPFFVEEVIRMLIDRGVIVRSDGRWTGTGTRAEVEIPETIQGLLLARIDRLDEEARRLLRVASVVGRQFTVDLLDDVHGDGDTRAGLGLLEAHGFVRLSQTSPTLAYAFRHALIQDAAYETLLRRERRELHGRVAVALEARPADFPGELAAVIARHFEEAGEIGRAIPYLLEAGRDALARYATYEAHDLFARTARHLDEQPDRDPRTWVEAGLGQAESGLTFVPGSEQLAILERILPAAEALGDEQLVARVHLSIGRNRQAIGEGYGSSPQLRASIDRARELGEALHDDHLRALPLAIIGASKLSAGRLREGASDLESAIPLLERQEKLADASIYASELVMGYARLGEFGAAASWVERATELGVRSGDPNAVLDADLARGVLEAERGNLRDALEHTQRAVAQAKEVGNTLCALVGSFYVGDQHLRLGEADDAIASLQESSQLATYCDAGSFVGLNQAWLAAAHARAGDDLGTVIAGFDAALAIAQGNGDLLGAGQIHHHRATALAAGPEPDWDGAFADFEIAVRSFEQLDAKPYLARTLGDFGRALELAGRSDEARAQLERAADLFAAMDIGVAGSAS